MPCHQMSAGLPRLAGGLGVALLAWVLALGAALAQDLLPVPALSARVIDQTATLTEPQRRVLETRLETLERETGAQLVVLIVASTQPEDIAAYTQRAAELPGVARALGSSAAQTWATDCCSSSPRTTGACASRWPRRWRVRSPT